MRLLFRNHPWCSLKNEWIWIREVRSKWWWVMHCSRRHAHLEFALPSLKTESPHTRPIWRKADERDISMFFIWQLFLPWHLILWTLAYVLYWRSICHVSHNNVSDLRKTSYDTVVLFELRRGVVFMYFIWGEIMDYVEEKSLTILIGNICEILTIDFKQNLTSVLL